MLQRILDEGYVKIDYEIDFPHEEFKLQHPVFRETPYWKLEMIDWTPFEEVKCEKWCSDMYHLNMDILNDPLYEDTRNCRASILRYNKGYIKEHTDRGMFTFLYNIYPGVYLKINEKWEELDYGLFIWLGDIGAKQFNRPAMEHKANCDDIRWSLNYFSAPSNIESLWTANEMTGTL